MEQREQSIGMKYTHTSRVQSQNRPQIMATSQDNTVEHIPPLWAYSCGRLLYR